MKLRCAAALLAVTGLALAGCTAAVSTPAQTPIASSTAAPPPPGTIVFRQFVDAGNSQGALFTEQTDGTHKVQLTKPAPGETDTEPNWSPDGTKIVFTQTLNTGTANEDHHLELMNADGTNLVALTSRASAGTINFNDRAAFSPDGKQIAYAHGDGDPAADQLKNTGLFVMNADGSKSHEVVTMPPYAGDVSGIAWSPDGTQLLYGVFNSATAKPSGGRAFFLVKTDGSDNHQLTKWEMAADGTPGWSAATNLIVFRVAPDEHSGVGNFFTMRPDGTELTQVTKFAGTVVSHKVGFSPDGKWIVFGAASKDGVSRVNLASIDGTRTVTLVPDGQASSGADWSKSQ